MPCGRRWRTRETLSRTSAAAESGSRERTNLTVIWLCSWRLMEVMTSTPSMPDSESSNTFVTWDSTTVEDAPTYLVSTVTTGLSILGYSRTVSRLKDTQPNNTINKESTVAKTGRLIDISGSCMPGPQNVWINEKQPVRRVEPRERPRLQVQQQAPPAWKVHRVHPVPLAFQVRQQAACHQGHPADPARPRAPLCRLFASAAGRPTPPCHLRPSRSIFPPAPVGECQWSLPHVWKPTWYREVRRPSFPWCWAPPV